MSLVKSIHKTIKLVKPVAAATDIFKTFNNGKFEIKPLSKECWSDVKVVLNAFFENEAACIGTEVDRSNEAKEELNQLSAKATEDGVSLMVKETATGRVVGVTINKIQTRESKFYERFITEECKNKNAKAFIESIVDMDKSFDIFTQYNNCDCYYDMVFGGVLVPEFARFGIAKKMLESATLLGRALAHGYHLDLLPLHLRRKRVTAMKAIPSSAYSLGIMKNLGWTEQCVISHENYFYNGTRFTDRITDRSKDFSTVLTIRL